MNTTFWIQFLGIIFGLAMMYFTYVRFKRKELNSSELLTWFTGWIMLIVVAIAPSSLDFIIGPLNFYRRLDFFVVFGFFLLFGLGFYNYSIVKKMERKLEVFVRKEAMDNHRKEKVQDPKLETKNDDKQDEKRLS
jgi:hypothetical protein